MPSVEKINTIHDPTIYGAWDYGLWLTVLVVLGATAAVGLLTPFLPLLAAMGWMMLVSTLLIPTMVGMFVYDVLSIRLEKSGWDQLPRTRSVLQAARFGGALVPILALVLTVTFPWSWPVIVAISLVAPLLMVLGQLTIVFFKGADPKRTPIDPVIHTYIQHSP